MSDEPALLAAIRAHPYEDTPRVAYADWLDENDRPERAEFIRVQIELDPWARPASAIASRTFLKDVATIDVGRITALAKIEFDLIEEFGAHWFDAIDGFNLKPFLNPGPELVRLGHHEYNPAHVRRGFVASLSCSCPAWLRYADALLAAHPITKVTLTTTPADSKLFLCDGALFSSPKWEGVSFALPPSRR